MPTTFEDKLLSELLHTSNTPTAAQRTHRVVPIAAAVALLAAGGLTLAGPDHASVAAPRPVITRPTIDLSDATAVLAATTAAMDQSAYAHVVTNRTAKGEADSTMELWVEPDGYVRRMKYSEGAVAKSDTQFPAAIDQHNGPVRIIDFATKTYTDHEPTAYRVLTLTDFRTQLDEGNYAVVGQEGDLTHLRETRANVQGDVWVDSKTFLPVKTTFASDVMTEQGAWTWVAKADAKDSDFVPPIPDGFTAR